MPGRALRMQQRSKRTAIPGDIPHQGIPPSPLTPDEGQLPEGHPLDTGMLPDVEIPKAEQGLSAPAPDAKQQVSDIVRGNTKYRIPPQANETFDSFRARALPVVRAAMQEVAHNPAQYIPILMQPQAVSVIDAWMDAGMPDDFSVNADVMKSGAGAVARLYPVSEDPGWKKEVVQFDKPLPPPPGILLISQGASDSRQQDAIAELAKHVKSGDFGRARAFAHKASTELGLSDEDIGHVIDSALPNAKDAAGLPHDKLLAVASAAHGTNKFPGYADLLRERFGNLDQLPPQAREQLQAHLGALGV